MGIDTVSWPVEGYRYNDITALPKKGILISFINNSFQINRAAGHVHWFWIKSGVVFRVGAAAYTGLVLVNNLTEKDPDRKEIKKGLLTGASVYLFEFILQKLYSPVHKMGKNYKLAYVNYAAPGPGTQCKNIAEKLSIRVVGEIGSKQKKVCEMNLPAAGRHHNGVSA